MLTTKQLSKQDIMIRKLTPIYSLAVIIILFSYLSSSANAINVTEEQIEKFKQLPQSQQKELMQQYGVNVDQTKPAQPTLTTTQPSTPTPSPATPRTEREPRSLNIEPTRDEPKKLKPFGYELFGGQPDSFSPASDIPPPDSYVLGPGDNLVVQLYGKENKSYSLIVSREGQVQFPDIGPITLAGLSFDEARKFLANTVQKQMIGVNASITMGTLRSIRIFVLGEALNPGSYTVSSLSTMTNALLTSGGVSAIGSLRNIQLKRNGKLITSLDLYDLLLNGDTSNDSRLLPGDVIFIPPIGETISINGAVKRPAIYEIKNESTIIESIRLAGGFKATAYPSFTRIERINTKGEKTLLNLDLTLQLDQQRTLRNADTITVLSVLDIIEDTITLKGHIKRPGTYAWKNGLRVTDVIPSIDNLLPFPDLNIAIIEREHKTTEAKKVITFDLEKALTTPNSAADLTLEPNDVIHIFNYEDNRSETLKNLIERLKLQAQKGTPQKTIKLSGQIRFPGEYPLCENITVQEAIKLAGGLTDKAFAIEGELTRKNYNLEEEQKTTHINVSIDKSSTFTLQAEDQLNIKRIPNWQEDEIVTIEGEVKFPGKYAIYRGETLTDVINRAGGLNDWAYPEAAIFTRHELKELEEQRIKELRNKLETEIAAANIEQQIESQKISTNDAEGLLNNLNQIRPLGRMVIDLNSLIKGKAGPIELKSGDRLNIPRKKQAITVVGEVQFPTSHIYDSKLDSYQYIERSGGTTQKADDSRIYIVKANGRVFLPEKSGWFSSKNHTISPGDTIVVPIDADRIKSLTLWTSVSQIFYQMALGAAAVSSF